VPQEQGGAARAARIDGARAAKGQRRATMGERPQPAPMATASWTDKPLAAARAAATTARKVLRTSSSASRSRSGPRARPCQG
jgi:hypothetical protein